MAEGWDDPYFVGQVIDRALDILAAGAVEKYGNCLFHPICEPGTRVPLLGRCVYFRKLLFKGLRADYGAVELRRAAMLFTLRHVYVGLTGLIVLQRNRV